MERTLYSTPTTVCWAAAAAASNRTPGDGLRQAFPPEVDEEPPEGYHYIGNTMLSESAHDQGVQLYP